MRAAPTDYTRQGQAWIDQMDVSVVRQQKLLGSLLERVSSDKMYHFLLISCSLAREAGDELSDVDTEAGIMDGAWPDGIEKVKLMTQSLGPVVDQIDHEMAPEMGHERRHLITIYEGNLQLSLAVSPSSWVLGLKPNAVALYDPGGRLAKMWDPSVRAVTSKQIREWTFLAWLDLADAAKYLKRGSPWEALERLHRARNRTWQLWAAAHKEDFALYGMTQVIDDGVEFPMGMERTVAKLEAKSIHNACLVLADILKRTAEEVNEVLPFELPRGMERTALAEIKNI